MNDGGKDRRVYERTDGRAGGRPGSRVGGRRTGRTDRQADGCMVRRKNRRMDKRTAGWIDRPTDRPTYWLEGLPRRVLLTKTHKEKHIL